MCWLVNSLKFMKWQIVTTGNGSKSRFVWEMFFLYVLIVKIIVWEKFRVNDVGRGEAGVNKIDTLKLTFGIGNGLEVKTYVSNFISISQAVFSRQIKRTKKFKY